MHAIDAIRQWLYITKHEYAARIERLTRKRIRVRRRDAYTWINRTCAAAAIAGLAHFFPRIVQTAISALHSLN